MSCFCCDFILFTIFFDDLRAKIVTPVPLFLLKNYKKCYKNTNTKAILTFVSGEKGVEKYYYTFLLT